MLYAPFTTLDNDLKSIAPGCRFVLLFSYAALHTRWLHLCHRTPSFRLGFGFNLRDTLNFLVDFSHRSRQHAVVWVM